MMHSLGITAQARRDSRQQVRPAPNCAALLHWAVQVERQLTDRTITVTQPDGEVAKLSSAVQSN